MSPSSLIACGLIIEYNLEIILDNILFNGLGDEGLLTLTSGVFDFYQRFEIM